MKIALMETLSQKAREDEWNAGKINALNTSAITAMANWTKSNRRRPVSNR